MSHRTLGTAITVTALAVLISSLFCRRCYHRSQTRPKTAPEHIQNWESEGGGVPVDTNRTAAQVSNEGVPPIGTL